jgi:GYF domain 2
MGRERWFYGQHLQRRGPVSLAQLVEAALAQADPRATLVWRKGLAGWTRAEEVPEVGRRLAPSLEQKELEAAARLPPASVASPPLPAYGPPPTATKASALLYGGIGAATVLLIGVGAWLVWPRPRPATPVPLGGETTESAPAVVIPAPGSAPAATSPPAPAAKPVVAVTSLPAPSPTPVSAGLGDREDDLPRSELRKLRGVAAWSGTRLRLTVYNGTAWRVTELYVKIGRFTGDRFLEDDRPVLLLPPARKVDAGVADLLSKVAPDRKKPGLNPLDTGPFEGEVGERPESFRFEIESARGYPPV